MLAKPIAAAAAEVATAADDHADASAGERASAVPADMRARLTPEQAARLEHMLATRSTAHAFDYRASTSFLGRRFYLAVLAGAEARSSSRLDQEGLSRRLPSVLFDVAMFCLGTSVLICLATGIAVVWAYVAKSALGIDLTEGPSFLHDLLYWR